MTMPLLLKPCPFCGGDPYLSSRGDDQWAVYCLRCYAMVDSDSRTDVVWKWNTRYPSSVNIHEQAP
jgi:Lar family restriction alleviation protein